MGGYARAAGRAARTRHLRCVEVLFVPILMHHVPQVGRLGLALRQPADAHAIAHRVAEEAAHRPTEPLGAARPPAVVRRPPLPVHQPLPAALLVHLHVGVVSFPATGAFSDWTRRAFPSARHTFFPSAGAHLAVRILPRLGLGRRRKLGGRRRGRGAGCSVFRGTTTGWSRGGSGLHALLLGRRRPARHRLDVDPHDELAEAYAVLLLPKQGGRMHAISLLFLAALHLVAAKELYQRRLVKLHASLRWPTTAQRLDGFKAHRIEGIKTAVPISRREDFAAPGHTQPFFESAADDGCDHSQLLVHLHESAAEDGLDSTSSRSSGAGACLLCPTRSRKPAQQECAPPCAVAIGKARKKKPRMCHVIAAKALQSLHATDALMLTDVLSSRPKQTRPETEYTRESTDSHAQSLVCWSAGRGGALRARPERRRLLGALNTSLRMSGV